MLGHLSLRQQQPKSLSHWLGSLKTCVFTTPRIPGVQSTCEPHSWPNTATCLEHHKLHTAKFTGLISDCVKKLDWVQTTFPKWLNSIKQDARLTTRQTPGQTTTCSQETLGQRAIDTNGKKPQHDQNGPGTETSTSPQLMKTGCVLDPRQSSLSLSLSR